ncbi:hypothetical protein [Methylomonas fluvii]|nr:hypothetical protein [Methylomonas fluvii]
MAHLSSHARHIIVSNSGHFIMQDQTDAFVAAVHEVVLDMPLVN